MEAELGGYKYAITSNQTIPEVWSNTISPENNLVTINSEGEKYLHIITYDNAGNVSEDKILGPYKIDFTEPDVESIVPVNKDWTNEAIDITVTFLDKGQSGFLRI